MLFPFPPETNSLFIMITVFSLSRFFTDVESLLNGISTLTPTIGAELVISVVLSASTILIGLNSDFPHKAIIAIIAYIACGFFLIIDAIGFFSFFSKKKESPPLPPSPINIKGE